MTVARIYALATILLAGLLPTVKGLSKADECREGIQHSCGLSTGARIGIGIGLLWILFIGFIVAIIIYRRRRVAVANLAYVNQDQPGVGNVYPDQPSESYQPKYPYQPQAYGPGGVHASDYAYDPKAGFAPPSAQPPPYYAPAGAPPVEQIKGYQVIYYR